MTRSAARGESWNNAEMKSTHNITRNLLSHYSSSVPRRARSHLPLGGDAHNITRNLEADFNEAELLPKT
jgi:hypothetical protein